MIVIGYAIAVTALVLVGIGAWRDASDADRKQAALDQINEDAAQRERPMSMYWS